MKITPVILSGGSGTRLWPISRQSNPKQFSNFFGEQSLFQKTVLRFKNNENFENPRSSIKLFYADWCPHCAEIHPEFDNLQPLVQKFGCVVEKYNEKKVEK